MPIKTEGRQHLDQIRRQLVDTVMEKGFTEEAALLQRELEFLLEQMRASGEISVSGSYVSKRRYSGKGSYMLYNNGELTIGVGIGEDPPPGYVRGRAPKDRRRIREGHGIVKGVS